MAYRNTLQADALQLVAKKLQSSLAVEGELPEDGLAAYGDEGDELMLALARKIVAGIQSMISRTDFDGAETVVYEWSLRDGRGDPLCYPIQLVARTTFDVLPRVRDHKERRERLEGAASEARAGLSARRIVLDKVETITAYAQEMSEFLATSELTESKAFIRSFVKEIAVAPGAATIRYTIPMPEDSPLRGDDAEEVALGGPVLSTVKSGGRYWIRTSDLCDVNAAL